MKLLILFCVLLALVAALNPLKKLKKRLSFKARKGHPFAVNLLAEGQSLPKKKSLWSRMRGALRPKAKATAGKKKRKWGFFKEMIEGSAMSPTEAFEGSAVAPDDGPIAAANQTRVFDDVQSRVTQQDLYMNGNNYRRCMIRVTINNKAYDMLFDTASSAGMIPEINAQVTGTSNFGRVEPLYVPPATANPSRLPILRHNYAASGETAGFVGRLRRGRMTLAGMRFPVDFVSAHELNNMRYPMMGASPEPYALGGTQIVPQILQQTNEPLKRFTTFVGPPSSNTPGAVNGVVVFGDTDTTRCPDITAWMPDNSSGGGQFPAWNVYFTEVYVSGSHTARVSIQAVQHPKHAKLDTGTPGIRLQEDLFTSFIEMFVAVTGVTPSRNAPGRKYLLVPCNMRNFIVYVRVLDVVSQDTIDIPIRAANILHPKNSDPQWCELLVSNGGQGYNLFGYPFYRSTCVVHDYDNMRVGIAPHAGVF